MRFLLLIIFLNGIGLCGFTQSDAEPNTLSPAYWNNLANKFRNFRNFLGSYDQSVTNYTWTVPQGVTRLMIECWGGGAASNATAGGEGGGYAMAIVPVVPGTQMELSIGWGGRGNAGPAFRVGQPTTAAWIQNGSTFYVRGNGGYMGDAALFFLPAGAYNYSRKGNPGSPSESFYTRKTTTVNAYAILGGKGGAPYGFPHQTGAGTNVTLFESNNAIDVYALASDAPMPGGGAGGKVASVATSTGVFQNGGPGMILIRW